MERRKRALVVEDDPGVADVVRYRLTRCGFTDERQVVVAPHALAAMREIDEGDPDVVLLDLRLPKSERDLSAGEEVGRDLLQYAVRRRPNTPVIVMTAYAGTTVAGAAATASRYMKLGASDFITKDFEASPDSLEDLVKAALAKREQTKETAPSSHSIPPRVTEPVRVFVDQHSLADGMGKPRDRGTVKLFVVCGDELSETVLVRRTRFDHLERLARGPVEVVKDSSEDRAVGRLCAKQLNPWGVPWKSDGERLRRRTYRILVPVSIHRFAGALDPAAEVRRLIREEKRSVFRP